MDKLWLFNLSRLLVLTFCKLYFRIEFEGVERIPQSGPMIMAPNHASYFDPLWVSIPVKRPMRYMTWDKMVRLPLLGPLMTAYGAFPVNVDAGDRGALRSSLEQLKMGGGLVIFPEGSRTRTGRLLPFKPGVIRLATETCTPVLPVTILGGYRAFAPHHFFPRPYKLKIIYHAPIRLDPPTDPPELKQFYRDETARLQSIVCAPLPVSELPEDSTPMIKPPVAQTRG